MLIDTAQEWMQRVQRDEKFRDTRLESLSKLKQRYHGPAYKDDSSADEEYFPENFYYKFVGLMVPRLIFDNPRVWVKSRRPGAQGEVAEAMRHGLNRWVVDSKLRKTLEDLAYDMLFAWGVSLTTLEAMAATGDQSTRWPRLHRISPKRFGMDSMAKHPRDARYKWHMSVRDKDDLIALAKADPETWNLQALKALTADAGTDKLESEAARYGSLPPNQVVYYEIWYPEKQVEGFSTDDGFHGTLYTIALGQDYNGENGKQKLDFIRPPRPYYGPKEGPYNVYGCYRVPDELYPLSPLLALDGQITDLNNQVIAAARSNRRHKKVGVVESTDPVTDRRLTKAQDGEVIPVKNFDKTKYSELEMGGATTEQRVQIQDLRAILAENSGLSDPQTGMPSGSGTATEHAIADQASTTRTGFIRKQFQDGTSADLTAVAWYMFHTDEIVFPLGEEAAESLAGRRDVDLLFQGGDHGEASGAKFEDLELEIEAFSMERTDEALLQRRMAEMDNLVLNVAPLIPQMPHVDFQQYLYLRGQMANFPELGRIIDIEAARQMPTAPGPEENQPRLLKNLRGDSNEAVELAGRSSGAQSGADRRAS